MAMSPGQTSVLKKAEHVSSSTLGPATWLANDTLVPWLQLIIFMAMPFHSTTALTLTSLLEKHHGSCSFLPPFLLALPLLAAPTLSISSPFLLPPPLLLGFVSNLSAGIFMSVFISLAFFHLWSVALHANDRTVASFADLALGLFPGGVVCCGGGGDFESVSERGFISWLAL